MDKWQLFMILLGCKPEGRNTEQHDIFFGIARTISELVPDIQLFWPQANGKIHIDAWQSLSVVDGYEVIIEPRNQVPIEKVGSARLFFLNLGGYKPDSFEEYHYKMVLACSDKGEAVQRAKQTAFYQHMGFDKATSHIDDKYGVDVDDLYEIADILPASMKEQFSIQLRSAGESQTDPMHLGYLKLDKLS